MGILLKRVGIVFLLVSLVWAGLFLAGKAEVTDMGIDSVGESLLDGWKKVTDFSNAQEYVRQHLPQAEAFLKQALQTAEVQCRKAVNFVSGLLEKYDMPETFEAFFAEIQNFFSK